MSKGPHILTDVFHAQTGIESPVEMHREVSHLRHECAEQKQEHINRRSKIIL